MYNFVIHGGTALHGSIPVFGSKNAALPLLAATLLTSEPLTLSNLPPIVDVTRMTEILTSLGVTVEHHDTTHLTLRAKEISVENPLSSTVGLLRGSILLLGALVGRRREASLPLPGGDVIGARPIDTHLDAFRQLGAVTREEGGVVRVDGSKMKAGRVVLREFSVTATENILLACATLPGTTTIHIAAAEPHVVALAELLGKMGARIHGAGAHTITVEGTPELHGAEFANIPDMLEAGFFILFAAVAGSEVSIENVPVDDLLLFFKKLDDIGIHYAIDEARRRVTVKRSSMRSFKMQALPHPGIPTDLQAPFAVVATQANGSSLIHDPLYEGRLRHIVELQKMGATAIICDPHRVIINGPTPLCGKVIPSLDIRSGATLIMAGLVAEGQTVINQAEVIDRGYAQLVERLSNIGADIKKVEA